jgi:hypothetical protein
MFMSINRYNIHTVLSAILTYYRWEFRYCKAIYVNIIYRYKYIKDLMIVGIKSCSL